MGVSLLIKVAYISYTHRENNPRVVKIDEYYLKTL